MKVLHERFGLFLARVYAEFVNRVLTGVVYLFVGSVFK
jgi:hypothetical protein